MTLKPNTPLILMLLVLAGCSKTSPKTAVPAPRRLADQASTSDGKAKADASAQAKVATSNASQVKTITDSDYQTLEKSVSTTFASASVDQAVASGVASRAVVVVNDSTTLEPAEKQALYTKIDAGMKLLFDNGLRPAYGTVIFLGRGEPDGEATWDNFVKALKTLSENPSINHIDAIVNVHGSDGATGESDGIGRAYFIGGAVSADDIAAALTKNISDANYYKLGVVYDQACFSVQHMAGYVKGGFYAAAGTIGEHGTGIVDYPTFVRYWGGGSIFSRTLGAQDAVGAVGQVLLGWFNPPPPEENDTWQTVGMPDQISIDTVMTPPAI